MNNLAEPKTKNFDELMQRAKQRGRGASATSFNVDKPNTSNRLPFFKIGGMPNHINRSSLIAPIGGGNRKFHRNSLLISRQDCKIEYSGEQLDEADGDILMALLYFARGSNTGEEVFVKRARLLKLMRRGTGKAQYTWLESRMNAITTSTLSITTKHYQIGRKSVFHIISGYELDQATEAYKYRLDKEWVHLFSRREFSLLNWEKRMQIKHRFSMAKALQRLISTDSSRIQKYNIQSLKEQFVYTGRGRDFLTILVKNLEPLKCVGLINAAELGHNSKGDLQLVLSLPANDLL